MHKSRNTVRLAFVVDCSWNGFIELSFVVVFVTSHQSATHNSVMTVTLHCYMFRFSRNRQAVHTKTLKTQQFCKFLHCTYLLSQPFSFRKHDRPIVL